MGFLIAVEASDISERDDYLSYQFVLSPTKVTAGPGDLYFDDLWVVVRSSSEGYLWCRLRIASIEETMYGEHFDYYLLTGDIDRSEYFASPSQKSESLRIGRPGLFSMEGLTGVVRISDEQERALQKLAAGCVRTSMVRPNDAVVEQVWRPVTGPVAGIQLDDIVRALKLRYTVSDLYRYSRHPKHWSPYESFACSYLDRRLPQGARAIRLSHKSAPTEPKTTCGRSVDTAMREIEPDKVRVRRFVNPPENQIDAAGLDTYLKTERADHMHQAMVADLAKRIVQLGQVPRESGSIDLFTEGVELSLLIEVKSANEATFYRQCVKGAMQLMEYAYCLKTYREISCSPVIVLEYIADGGLKTYLAGLLRDMGITMLTYDRTRNWPDRVSGFDVLVQGQRGLDECTG